MNQSQVVNIAANRGVILSTGGFEFDARMKVNYLKCSPYHLGGWQYNTGDGIKMAMKAGGGLWHMNTTSGRYSPWIPTYNTAWAQHHTNNAYIWTDRYGNRFCNESGLPSHSTWQVAVNWNFTYGQYNQCPALLVFDSTSINQPVAGGEDPRLENRGGVPPGGTEGTDLDHNHSDHIHLDPASLRHWHQPAPSPTRRHRATGLYWYRSGNSME